MKVVYIYGLYTSQNEEIRYVGKCNDLDYRLKMHYSQRNSKKSYKNEWIKKSIKKGEKIHIKILEEVNENNWSEKEKEWINRFDNLTNLAEGGKGGSIKKYNIEYEEMKDIIREYNIKSKMCFIKFTKSGYYPIYLPKDPPKYFKDKWISWGDFLGTNRKQDNKIAENYITYEEAKEYINKNFNIKSIKEWKKNLDKIPNFIPKRPERFYKNRGWISWVDFFNKKRIANQNRKIINYEDAKKIIKDLNIKTIKQYKKIQSEFYINELPVHPHLTYKNKGFKNYDDFFERF